MDLYIPQLSNGRPIRLPFQLAAYAYNFMYPLNENASSVQHTFKLFCLFVTYICYVGTLIGELTFVYEHINNIPLTVDCLATTCIGLQFFIRIICFGLLQEKLRSLLARFYKDTYIYSGFREHSKETVRSIKKHERFMHYYTLFYFLPGIMFLIKFTREALQYDLFNDFNKPYIYRMSFRLYNAQEPVAYVLTSMYNCWLTYSAVSIMAGCDYTLSLVLLHTSYRFKELRKDLSGLLAKAREQSKSPRNVSREFQTELHEIFKRQQQLNSFIAEASDYFTYQIFIGIVFGIFIICMVMFQLQATSVSLEWTKYITWFLVQIMQMVIIGYYGQMLTDETTSMQQSFFMCQWEELLTNGDTQTNRQLMIDIKIAIMNAQKPVLLDGLKMFKLNRQTIGMALRSAVSYFMFLNTMNNANK